MKKTISSQMTFIYKFILPAVWLGGFGLGAAATWSQDHPGKWIFLASLIAGALLIVWLCVPLKRVEIDGSELVVSNFSRTCRVPLSDIHRVTENVWINIHPIWIHFRQPTGFGRKIIFMPTARMLSLFSPHPLVAELKELARNENSRQPQQ